jgi:hypothetical protein
VFLSLPLDLLKHLSVLLLALVAATVALAQPPAHPLDAVRAALDARVKKLQSLRVDYRYKYELLDSPEVVKRYMHLVYLVDEQHIFAFKGDKRYFRRKGPREVDLLAADVRMDYSVLPPAERPPENPERLRPPPPRSDKPRSKFTVSDLTETAFDGTRLCRKLVNRVVEIENKAECIDDRTYFSQGYLAMCGEGLPDVFNPQNPHESERLVLALRKKDVRVLPTPEVVDGAACVVVKVGEADTVWFDPALQYAVRKWEVRNPEYSVLAERRTFADFTEVLPNVWLPRQITRDRAAPPLVPPEYKNKPLLRITFTASRITATDVPDDLFRFIVPTGMMVVDRTARRPGDETPTTVSYIQPADPDKVEEEVQRALNRES